MSDRQKMVLTEWYELQLEPSVIEEAKAEPNKPLILKDRVLQRSETKNHNGRIYPREILMREVKKYDQLVKERRALGELDHPDSPIVELKNACLLVTDIRMEGDEVRGTVEILNTPPGQILKNLALQGVRLGVSSRGVGSLKEDIDGAIVQDDFELIAFDAVSSPSTPGAYLVTEGKLNKVDIYNDLRSVLYDINGEDYFE
jgi:hypothetical protein